jgi:hypothetical protein
MVFIFVLNNYKSFKHAKLNNIGHQQATWSPNLPDSQKSFGGQYNLVRRQVPDPLFFALQVTLFNYHDILLKLFSKKREHAKYKLVTHSPTALFARKMSPAQVPQTGFPPPTNSRSAWNCTTNGSEIFASYKQLGRS